MSAPRLVLASTSPYRREVLGRLGLPFTIARPDFDERAPLPAHVLTTADTATHLARGKARSVASLPEHAGAWIIGSDQIVEVEGEIMHKPGGFDAAVAQLLRMQGRPHRLVTAVVVLAGEREAAAVDTHVLHMRALTPAQARAYVEADRPLDCAGSYRIEARGIALFDRIEADPECADDTAIMGLPLWKTVRALRALGFDPLDP
ncbi:MAG: septum formation protein Maf [Deltaproteobacteria bacterium]|nr:septum formation protein Maf [Deltaproteobacteria bacterium]